MLWRPQSHARLPPFPLKAAQALIALALLEDIPAGDLTTRALHLPETRQRFVIRARQPLTVCGMPLLLLLFDSVEAIAQDGAALSAGAAIATLSGNAAKILEHERVALNFLQYLSGIATLTARYANAIQGTKARLLDTRKTAPGYRALAKYAAACGGALNHRCSLSDGLLIKDNHIAAAGSVATAVGALRRVYPDEYLVLECDTLAQVEEGLRLNVPHLLLDNMPLEALRKAVALCNGRAALEASGGITLETIRAVADTGVDYMSVGALTHSAPAVDIGLDDA